MKSRLVRYLQIYLTLLGTKQIAIDCQNNRETFFKNLARMLSKNQGDIRNEYNVFVLHIFSRVFDVLMLRKSHLFAKVSTSLNFQH
jgi:hypothetical protein